MARPKTPGLTEYELSIMNVLWRESPLSVQSILERLGREPPPAYTSLLTIVRTMEQKGHLTREKDGKAHLYAPAVAKNAVKKEEMKRLINGLFNGNGFDLAVNLVKSEKLSAAEKTELKKLLEDL